MNNDWINKLRYFYNHGTEGIKMIYIFTISSVCYWILHFILLKIFGINLDTIVLLSAEKFIPFIWTIFSFPFVQGNFWDLFFVMIMLYFSEKIFRIYFDGKSFIKFLFLGNLSAGIIFLLYSFIAKFSVYLGGTIFGVYSIIFAVISYNPKMKVSLFPLPVQIPIYVLGLVFVGLDLFSIMTNLSSSMVGIFIARIGAAAFGYFYMKSFQSGNDFLGKLVPDFNTLKNIKSFIYNKRKQTKGKSTSTYSRPLSDEEFNDKRVIRQKRIDAILEKISKHGYENLTKEEKEFLFNSSKEL